MNRNYDRELKDAFPPTPQVFTISMEAALRALPHNERRWKAPRLSLAAYALAACAVFTGVFVFAVSPAVAPPSKSNPPAASPSPSQLPQANQTAFKAADGWQAAAVAGDTQWFYNPRSGDIGRIGLCPSPASMATSTSESYVYTSDGSMAADTKSTDLYQAYAGNLWQAATFKLDITAGWSVDTYTFLPSNDGRWLAFTLHGPKGDDVWVVTQDGRKMSVMGDVQWVDSNSNPVKADFSEASLAPFGNSNIYLVPATTGVDSVQDGVSIRAIFPNGDAYLLQVSLNTVTGSKNMLLDDRRGGYMAITNANTDQVLLCNRNYFIRVQGQSGGKYAMVFGDCQTPVEIQSENFSLCRFPVENVELRPNRALLVYAGDPAQTLWELNIQTGQETKIATGCVAADWIDETNYWYAADPDCTAVVTREADGVHTVDVQIHLSYNVTSDNAVVTGAVSVAAQPYIIIQNLTDADVTIPSDIPCSLMLLYGGKTVWSKDGTFKLSDADQQGSEIYNDAGDSKDIGYGPATLPPGYLMQIWLPQIPCPDAGEYTLEGSFYNQDYQVHTRTFSNNNETLPDGVSYQGALDADGTLRVTVENHSRTSFECYEHYQMSDYPTVSYRLLSGDKVLESGKIVMNASLQPTSQFDVTPGGSYTFTAKAPDSQLTGLPAGQYDLQCCLGLASEDGDMPWGMAYGYYFDVPVTVP